MRCTATVLAGTALASLLIGFSARARQLEHIKTQNGNDMVEACRIVAEGEAPPPDEAYRTGICLGEIEALTWIAPGLAGDPIRACVPKWKEPQEIAKVVSDYLNKYPEQLREPFEGLALEAMADTWPCPRKQAGWLAKLWARIFPSN